MSGLQAQNNLYYDIVICGAGPAGCAAALSLRKSGLKVALLDKAAFPRDKVCGDAIPGRAVKTLFSLGDEFKELFTAFKPKLITKKTAIFYKNRQISFDWVGEAYTCTRWEFDNFLFETTKTNANADIYTECPVTDVQQQENTFRILTKDGRTFSCKLLIGADGAQSVTAKKLAGRSIDRSNHVGSVRTYYSNVTGLSPDTTEVYFDKKYLPSYMWVFPLPDNTANVGFGMLSETIAKKKINLKELFHKIIEETPQLKKRLSSATQTSPLEGFGLPLGATDITISGEGFMMTGDAASLIDPISGDGIGNAMLSGKLAGEQAIKCFKSGNFSAAYMRSYDEQLAEKIGGELRTHYHARRILAKTPVLLDTIFWAAKNPVLKNLIQKRM